MAQPVVRDVSNKLTKEEARYRAKESCMTCGHFMHSGGCDCVEGNISPECVCDKYAMIEKLPEMKHAEFYNEAYQKSK